MRLKHIFPFNLVFKIGKKYGFIYKGYRSVAFLNFIIQKIFRYNNTGFSMHYTSMVSVPDKITFHESNRRSFMTSGHCYYQAGNGIEIGAGTIWAPGVKMISANHDPENLKQWIKTDPIRIGKNCWIGANAVILPGVQLGDHVIVGAGAIVVKSFPDNCVIAGDPAKIIKTRQK